MVERQKFHLKKIPDFVVEFLSQPENIVETTVEKGTVQVFSNLKKNLKLERLQ